jgi:hypothetical protein
MIKYGTEEAPIFPLENIKEFPVALFLGLEDKLATKTDVLWLKD